MCGVLFLQVQLVVNAKDDGSLPKLSVSDCPFEISELQRGTREEICWEITMPDLGTETSEELLEWFDNLKIST